MTATGQIGHISPEDLALYAMQLLDAKEHAEAQRHLSECSECRSGVAAATGDLALVALTTEMHSPPAFARERLMKQVMREKKVVAIRSAPAAATGVGAGSGHSAAPERRRKASVAPWIWAGAGWAAAAAMLLATIAQTNERRSMQRDLDRAGGDVARLSARADHAEQVLDLLGNPDATRVSLTKGGARPAPTGRATYLPNKGALVFIASNMDALPPYKTYELWVIPANGHDPIPAGTFQPDAKGNATLLMPDIPKNVEAKAFGVTIEDQGGSPTPTLPIVMSGS